MSALVAAQKINSNDELPVYGIVTDGELWQFGRLIQNEFSKEKIRLTINELSEIFGAIAYLLESVVSPLHSVPTMEDEPMAKFTIQSSFGRKKRAPVTLTVGETYRVEPLNPRKKKHRGRVCTILEFDNDFMPRKASVRFHDTNRVGKVELSDLVPVGQTVPVDDHWRFNDS